MSGKKLSTSSVIKIGILSALGFLLMELSFPLPFMPPFLRLDAGDVPAVIGGIAMGPWAAFFIQLIKNVVKFAMGTSETGGVGELANFLIGTAFVVPLIVIFKRKPSPKRFAIASVVGVICMVIAASLLNYFVLLPLYAMMYGGMEAIIGLVQAVNSNVSDVGTLIVLGIVPFNIIKGTFSAVLGYFVYKKLEPFLKKYFTVTV